jgi:DNA-binding transcriptional LysR family regulator
MPSEFDWNNLRSFLAVARYGRLTVAAARLGSDHTTIARRINALESALRTKLFDRSHQGYALTSQGAQLLPLAESMESLALKAQDVVGEADLSIEGTVRVGAPEGFGTCFLAGRVAKLCEKHPGLVVQIVAGPNTYSLSKREADIAVVLSQPPEGRLVARKLTDFNLGLYSSRAYLDSAPPIHSPADLTKHRFIGYIDDLIHAPELDYLHQINSEIVPQIESSNLIAQYKATLSGAGICVLPNFITKEYDGFVPVLPETVRLTRSFWMVTPMDLRDLVRIRLVAKFIADEVRASRDLFEHTGASRPKFDGRASAAADAYASGPAAG